jgi:hypothetical protein
MHTQDPAGPPALLAIDTMPGSESIIVGDQRNDIWGADLMEDDASVLVEGQSGDVCGIAPHHTMPQFYATACGDGSMYDEHN